MIDLPSIEAILYASTSQPHAILGMHSFQNGSILRVFDPVATRVEVKINDTITEVPRVDANGFFCLPFKKSQSASYTLLKHYGRHRAGK